MKRIIKSSGTLLTGKSLPLKEPEKIFFSERLKDFIRVDRLEEEKTIIFISDTDKNISLYHYYIMNKRLTSNLSRILKEADISLKPGDEVDLLIGNSSPLGVNVLINDEYEGLIFHEDIFKPLKKGERIKGYIKKIREDQKIDVTLERFGYRKVEPNAARILKLLKDSKGVLPLTDKSHPDDIAGQLQMSKKVFKKAIGALYKQRLIEIREDGISLKKP